MPRVTFAEQELHYEEEESVSINCTIQERIKEAEFIWYYNGVEITPDLGNYELPHPCESLFNRVSQNALFWNYQAFSVNQSKCMI